MLSNFHKKASSNFCRFFKIISKACLIPHPEKAHFGGEDYYFISKNNTTVGVADGVGGWSDIPGSNSSKYSRDIMNFCNKYSDITNPLIILQAAYNDLDFSVPGSTTALVAQICDNSKLHICNVGDSALGIFRNGKLVFQTQDTVHGFNFPFQLGFRKIDKPSDGTYDIFPIQEGDIIISGTDGLWDNMWNTDIERAISETLNKTLTKSKIMQILADSLAKTSNKNGKDQSFNSPFADACSKKYGQKYLGGKLDDVTVIASYVVDDNKVKE